MMSNFKLEKETVSNLSLDILKFYYESAQKRLSDYREQEKNTTERGYKLISIYLGIATALISYIYIHWNIEDRVILSLLLIFIATVLASGCMMAVIFPRYYIPLGKKPSDFKPNEMASCLKGVNNELQYKAILSQEFPVIQNAINLQEKYNRRRTNLFKYSLVLEIAGIITSSIIFFALTTN